MPNMNEYMQQLGAAARNMDAAREQFILERAREMERLRGIKWVKLPKIIVNGANPLVIQGDQFNQGPDQGWVWSVKRITITGLTSGATPDVVNINVQNDFIFQLNGNNPGSTFGKGDHILFPGEFLSYASVGTFQNTTGKIVIAGAAWEVPAEEIGKIL